MKAPPDACLTCGAAAQPGQEYCLRCGSRIVPGRRLSAVERAWSGRFGRYPGDWLWTSLLLLLVAAGSATAGIIASRDTGPGSGAATIVATSRIVTAQPAPPAPPPTTTYSQPRSTTIPAPATPVPKRGVIAWPARDGFTVVLASIPARGTGLADAQAKAKAALAGGLRNVGVLDSGTFASLHPGYYVVFAGVYGSLEEAQTAASRLAPRFPNVYARQIAR